MFELYSLAAPRTVLKSSHSIRRRINNRFNIADQICPLIGYETICEEITPYVIEWVQLPCTSDMVCAALCDSDPESYFIVDDDAVPHPIILVDEDMHATRDLGHHPFDLPHPETTTNEDLHATRDIGHHPFDLPHTDPEPISDPPVPLQGYHMIHLPNQTSDVREN